jgi:agmatinase
MIDTIINCDKLDEADVVLLGVGYDKTASGRKGASKGPDAITKCLNFDVEYYDRFTGKETGYLNHIYYEKLEGINEKDPEEMVEMVENRYSQLYQKNRFVFLLGGEHSVSIGAFKSLSRELNPEDVTILQIDAHADMRNDDANANPDESHPSQYAHSCVMRRAVELGYNIVQVGLRSYCKEEKEFISDNKNKINVFEWGNGPTPSIQKIIDSIKTEKVYISLDVDGIDPAFLPATGTPVQGGLEWYYSLDLVREIIEVKELVGCDLVEVSPIENSELTEYGAAQITYHIISQVLDK